VLNLVSSRRYTGLSHRWKGRNFYDSLWEFLRLGRVERGYGGHYEIDEEYSKQFTPCLRDSEPPYTSILTQLEKAPVTPRKDVHPCNLLEVFLSLPVVTSHFEIRGSTIRRIQGLPKLMYDRQNLFLLQNA
jgi:hypothetical protein